MPIGRPPRLWLVALCSLFGLVSMGCAGRAPRKFPRLSDLGECRPAECEHAVLKMQRWSDTEHHAGRLPYVTDAGNRLDGPVNREVTRVIVVFHGRYGSDGDFMRIRNPPGLTHYRHVRTAFNVAHKADPGLDRNAIAVIAPTFQRTDEWEPYSEKDRRFWHWPGSTWLWGRNADEREADRKFRRADPVPSHELIDDMLRQTTIKFPNLEQIVLVGHSAGGQAVHRYALLGTGLTERLERSGIAVRFVPTNPGSYAFLAHRRLLPPGRKSMPGGRGNGENPSWRWTTPSGCPGYDDYRFGLSNLESMPRARQAAEHAMKTYLPKIDKKGWRKARRAKPGSATWDQYARRMLVYQYSKRDVWHFQAASDTKSGTSKCEWLVQGRSRVERFRHQQRAWLEVNPDQGSRVRFIAVEGLEAAPHSGRAIYVTEIGRQALFY